MTVLLTPSLIFYPIWPTPSGHKLSAPLSKALALCARSESAAEKVKGRLTANLRFRRFLEVSEELGAAFPPPSLQAVKVYLCDHVARHNGNTHSIDGMKSNIKTSCERRNIPWLDEADRMALADVIRQLKYEDLSDIRRMHALRTKHLNKIIGRMFDAATTDAHRLAVLIEASLMKTTQQGVMRGGESTSGIRACDAMWPKKGRRIKLLLRRTKTSRTGPGVSVTLAVSKDPFCSVRLLRAQWDLRQLDDHPDAFLFPRITPDRVIVETSAYTADALRALVKRSVALIGLPPQGYSSHSLRSGGATDLLDAGVAETTVQQHGRWKSDAFRIYYRHNNQATKDVAAAFGWLARK